MTGETELHERLTRLAERTAPPPRESLAGTVAATHRARRRQTIGMTSLVAAVAALVVVTTTTLGGQPSAEPATVSGAATGPDAATATAPPIDVLAGPTRGSLAGDAAFVEAVRQLDWTPDGQPVATEGSPGVPDAPVDTRRVVFAGDVAGGRWALVVGENNAQPVQDDPELQTDLGALSDVAVAWFAGPPGATPDQLELLGVPRGVDPQYPQALFDDVAGALVVVTAPGDAVELSLRPDVAADTTVSRSWQPVDAPDGLLVTTLPPGGLSSVSVQYRVTRNGAEVPALGPDGRGDLDRSSPRVPLTRVRPTPPMAPGDVMVDVHAQSMLAQVGLPASDVPFTVPWAGDVPGPHDIAARLTVLAATLPSGAVYVDTPYGYTMDVGGYVGGSTCGSELLPAGEPIEQRTVAMRCDVTDGTADGTTVSSLVVIAPATASVARAVDLDGEVLAEFALTDGVAVVAFPERTATVQTLSPGGAVLSTARTLTFAEFGN